MMLGVDFIGRKFKLSQKERADRLAYYLPWNFLIGGKNDGIVYLKPGALMRTYAFTCPDLGSAPAETINSTSFYFNEAIRRLGDGWACHFEARREYTDKYPGSKWSNKLGFLIDARRKDLYRNKNPHFLNYYFLTMTYAVKPDAMSKASSLLYKQDGGGEDYFDMERIEKEIQLFRDVTEGAVAYIKSRMDMRPLDDDEIVTYIKSSISTRWRPSVAPREPVFFDQFITDEDMETGSCLKIGNRYCPMVAIRDFPAETYPAIFDLLNKAEVEYRWVTRWIGMDKATSSKLIEKYQKHFNNSRKSWGQVFVEAAGHFETDRMDPSAIAFEQDTNEAKVELSKDIASFGYYTSVVEVWHESYDVAMANAQYVQGIVNSCGFSAKVETTNSFGAWLGSLPGNTWANVRKTLLSSKNCSHIIPLSSLWTGDFYNKLTAERFGCSSPLLTATSFGSPFFLNMNVGDVFHAIVFGPSGAGKSTFLCLLESQFLKYKDAQVIVLDKDKTARGVTMGAGGSYVEPGSGEVAFQPLRDLETEEELSWACEFISLCLSEQGVHTDADRSETIRRALLLLKTMPKERRTLTTFQQYVQDKEAKAGIQPYTIEGQYGAIFDAKETTLTLAKFTMIEMGILMRMGEQCVTPALMYIFRLVESRFAAANDSAGHPTLLVMDEAWVFLQNPYFAERIDGWLRTLRKRRVAVVFATQDVESAAKSSVSSSIISQCQTKFFLADPNAVSERIAKHYVEFGLEPTEISALSQAIMKKDYFYKSPLGARMFQLELDDFQLALLCPPKAVLDELERKYGRNSGKQLAEEILEAQGYYGKPYLNGGGVR